MIWLIFTIGRFIFGTLRIVRAAVMTTTSLLTLYAAVQTYRATLKK